MYAFPGRDHRIGAEQVEQFSRSKNSTFVIPASPNKPYLTEVHVLSNRATHVRMKTQAKQSSPNSNGSDPEQNTWSWTRHKVSLTADTSRRYHGVGLQGQPHSSPDGSANQI